MQKQNQRGFILPAIIIIIAVTVLGSAGYLAYKQYSKPQTPNFNDQSNLNVQNLNPQTADWKTYTNTEYGFEIKFPDDIMISYNNDDRNFWNKISVKNPVKISGNNSGIDILIGTSKESIDNCLKFNFYEVLENMTDTKEINGIDFYTKSQGDAAMGGERGIITQYSIVRNNTCYTLQTQSRWRYIEFVHGATDGKTPTQEEIDNQNREIQNQTDFLHSIISTFKFTK